MKKGAYFIDETFFENDKIFLLEKKTFGDKLSANFIDNGYNAKVYVLELWTILSRNNFPLKLSTETLDGSKFIPLYISGYKRGREYFLKEYSLSNDTLYRNADSYIKNLHNCYFHSEPIVGRHGWKYYKESFPIIITNESIEQYGFFAGILFEIEELQKKHPVLFKDFENNCGLNDQTQHNATHREILIAHNFKVKANEAVFKTSTEWFKEGKQGRKEAFYNTDKNNKKKYREPTEAELINVVKLLSDFPNALKLATNELDRMQTM